jgi:A/G-specific adenine glycosylase
MSVAEQCGPFLLSQEVSFAELGNVLVEWFSSHRRDLPWRRSYDPYEILVSEVMLQQTQMERGVSYFLRWIARFPTVADLARADEEDVLRLWEGLGYYSRARNLLRTARCIVERHGGSVPRTLPELRSLPGIGPYTAGAILAIAWNIPEPALDANGERVLARLLDCRESVRSRKGRECLLATMRCMTPEGKARDFTQGLMEFGALLCTPRTPGCDACPLRKSCAALTAGTVLLRPVLPEKRVSVPLSVVAGILRRSDGAVFLRRRPLGGLLGGLWEFPGGKVEKGECFEEALVRAMREELGVEILPGPLLCKVSHGYTTFRVSLRVHLCLFPDAPGQETILGGEVLAGLRSRAASESAWVAPKALGDYPLAGGSRKAVRILLEKGVFSEAAEGDDAGP